jgi:multidrug efflux pump subunit AcrA (membrane-fusion protein)
MTELTNQTKLIAGAAIAALILGGGGVMLGRTVFAPDAVSTEAVVTPEKEEEEDHGPEGFIAMDGAKAQGAGIATEAVQSGGLGSEILAQGVVAATPEGEAILTARADGAVVRILPRLGDTVRAGQTIAVIESREAAAMAADRSAATARVTVARTTYNRLCLQKLSQSCAGRRVPLLPQSSPVMAELWLSSVRFQVVSPNWTRNSAPMFWRARNYSGFLTPTAYKSTPLCWLLMQGASGQAIQL